jgi:hypothetical protein
MTRKEILELCRTPDWKWGTPEGSELHTLLLGLTTTFQEKLQWLEEAENLVLAMRAGQTKTAPAKKTAKRETRRTR